MNKYCGKIYERNGEYEYAHPVLFETDADPMLALTEIARAFYLGQADEQDGGFYFFSGGIYVATESAVQVTAKQYGLLKRFI